MHPLRAERAGFSTWDITRHQTVTVDLSVKPLVQFGRWLDALPPQFCSVHPQTRLRVDRSESKGRFIETPFGSADSRAEPQPAAPAVPTVAFTACFHPCRACRVGLACAPPEFHETTFGTFDVSTPERAKALDVCRQFADQVDRNGCGFLLMIGWPGTGKTRLACNIIRKVAVSDCLYLTQARFTMLHRERYGHRYVHLDRRGSTEEDGGNEGPETIWTVAKAANLLVLDELGVDVMGADIRLPFDDLLKHRYDHRKATILISNLPLTGAPERPGFKAFMGDALADRIVHATGNRKFLLQFFGESYRRNDGEEYLRGLHPRSPTRS